jgi:methylase of polypeptide subunit release factors
MLNEQLVLEANDGRLTANDLTQTAALAHVLGVVAASEYRFTAITPLTHQRVLANRKNQVGTTLRDIFGWNLPFAPSAIAPALLESMEQAGILQRCGAWLRSDVRIATIDNDLFLHSAYPTVQDTAVFFGPDSYRFTRFVQSALRSTEGRQAGPWPACAGASMRILDVGCGSGAGGIAAARQLMGLGASLSVTMNDINPLALRYTLVNAELAGMEVLLAPGDALSAVTGDFDLIISNPPYLDDAAERIYRHGGARLGRALSVRIAEQALARLAPGGRLLLYTGVAIVQGIDPLRAELTPLLAKAGCDWSYAEIDPDVFGEELERPVYANADRIAAVGLIATRNGEAV